MSVNIKLYFSLSFVIPYHNNDSFYLEQQTLQQRKKFDDTGGSSNKQLDMQSSSAVK